MLRETPLYLRLNPADDVVIACRELEAGTNLVKEGVIARERIPAGHKVATRALEAGEPVRRYSQVIGFATRPIAAGDHVHVHNLEVRDFARDYAFGEGYRPTEFASAPATFQGIVRPDGRVATRNYIGILSTVNCSATVAKRWSGSFWRHRVITAASPSRPAAMSSRNETIWKPISSGRVGRGMIAGRNGNSMPSVLTLQSLPLFPLGTVLFPGGVLPLRIFEVRYLDMIGKCHKAGAPFGVVSLTEGSEVRVPSAPMKAHAKAA